ncbi:hypothetical protein GCM10010372_55380 [Streptomyces tauricus]|uniref:Secreted protein n=1 Tax=Streptomyces tauricus TaxID=68274 RepID=A0ABZ1JP65_9ACTN|nr:hypothetical protein [Streptomyces tauricus]MCW8099474.1 hypothetical protein [Streptomyces tauricus]GHA48374.1 hypothetical protein GCM10010372_55380 [Streptomyces tauricus]
MEAVVAIVAVIFLLFVALGIYATVKVVGAAKRGVDRTVAQARRTVEDSTLKAKTFAQPGALGQLAQLRLSLRTSMRATQEALQAGVGEDESLKESLALFDRLSAHGHELDGELKRLEREPDRARLAERLPALRERTEQITKSADALRWAARDRAQRFGGDDLDSLSTQIDMEAGALRHWTTEPSPTRASDPSPTGTSGPSPTRRADPAGAASPPPWPEAPSAATADQQTWPDNPEARKAEEPTRAAIDAPRQRAAYPWEKKPRPESTT